jgi:hypothetical protein
MPVPTRVSLALPLALLSDDDTPTVSLNITFLLFFSYRSCFYLTYSTQSIFLLLACSVMEPEPHGSGVKVGAVRDAASASAQTAPSPDDQNFFFINKVNFRLV